MSCRIKALQRQTLTLPCYTRSLSSVARSRCRHHLCRTHSTSTRYLTQLQSSLVVSQASHLLPLSSRLLSSRSSSPAAAAAAAADPSLKEGNSARYAFVLSDVTKRFQTGRTLFAHINLSFFDGAKIGVLGVNGCGKSSFLRIIAGVDTDYEGQATPLPGYKVGYLPQEPQLDESKNVMENIMEGVAEKQAILQRYDELSIAMGEPKADITALLDEQSKLQELIDRDNLWDLQYSIERAMYALGCPSGHAQTATLSGGEKRRVALCRLLLSHPDILCLDEPTNHLDADSVSWLEQFLATYRGLVIAITHDRYFLDNVAGYILEIDAGQLFPHKGNYASWLYSRSTRLALQQRQNAGLNKMIARELEWLHTQQKGTVGKNRARAANVQKLIAEREQRRKIKRSEGGSICLPQGPPLHHTPIITVSHLTHWHDDCTPQHPILDDVSFTVESHDIVGIIGANGTGKTTLLRLLLGERPVKQGQISIHPEVVFGYVNQHRHLIEDNYVWQEIIGTQAFITIDADYSMPARAYVAQFNFSGSDQQKRIYQLSGGERNRVNIAKSLSQGCNVIVLDEPTNDLDVDTLRGLEDAIQDWHGAAIIVSHDRWFLDRVCNKIIALESDDKQGQQATGKLTVYEGGWKEYEYEMQQKHKRKQPQIDNKQTTAQVGKGQDNQAMGEKKKFKKLAG